MVLLPSLSVPALERDEKFFDKKKKPALRLFTALLGGINSAITAPAAREEKSSAHR